MSMKSVTRVTASFALLAACFSGLVHAKGDAAEPFGISIGGSCEAGLSKMGETKAQPTASNGRVVTHHAVNPEVLYVGASAIALVCYDDVVAGLELVAPKGFGNPATRDAYQSLSKLYKRVAGGPIPTVGDGYARFVKGSSVIELNAPHMASQFSLVYSTKAIFDSIVSAKKKAAADKEITNSRL